MKKQLLILTLGASFLLANSNDTDLLSQVTKNSVNGAQYELNNQDMEKVDGGYTSFGSPVSQVFYGGIASQMNNLLKDSNNRINTSSNSSNSNSSSSLGNKMTSQNLNKPSQTYYFQSKDGKIYYGNSLSSIQVPYVGYIRR
ncbi:MULTISPECIES: hypothetical protein [Arcobacteraceae]|uniref:hypothetical protein n=1 Tax=Arcobacteraceae TaxID=2808963 RepID=UPI000DEB4A49|nr:hypothetical protein [Arcobacter sp. CECT 9188]RBQ27747.1 hypothetical protein CRU88_03495 [Arcobacter sp. CECT 9188]